MEQAQPNTVATPDKLALLTHFTQLYLEFIHKINAIPAIQLGKAEAFKHFDTGFLWFEKAISNFVPQPMPTPPPTDITEEVKLSEPLNDVTVDVPAAA